MIRPLSRLDKVSRRVAAMTASYRQQVPRPEDARAGVSPRWTEIDTTARAHIPVDRVREAFASVRFPEFGEGSAEAAVLVAMEEIDDEANVVLIRRADDLVIDPTHIAFPGGHVEAGETPLEAALRESEEEIGLKRADVEVIGAFPALGRRRGDARVVPFVGVVRDRPPLERDRVEVAEILEVPLCALAAVGASWQEVWTAGAENLEMTFFAGIPELGSELVWGLSARILSLLLTSILLGAEKPTV